jgi:hypothetical protein
MIRELNETEINDVSGGPIWMGPLTFALVRYAFVQTAKETAKAGAKAGATAVAANEAGKVAAELTN